jgi:phage-related protein
MSDYYEPSVNPDLQSSENKIVNKALSATPVPYLSGLKLKRDISLGPLKLNTIDSDGVVWVCTDLDGWWNLPDPEFPDLTRGWGDGSYDASGRYAARLINLTGSFLTQDPSQVVAARRTLIEAIDLVYRGALLLVDEPDISKSSLVRISGRPDISSVRARGRHDFSVGLKAVDPIKYEYLSGTYRQQTLSSGASATIVNSGNIKTPLIFELSGTMSGGTITNTYNLNGNSITETIGGVTKASSGYVTKIDTYNRAVTRVIPATQVSTSARGDINTYVEWLQLQPGSNTIRFSPTGGSSPSCKIYSRSGWIG